MNIYLAAGFQRQLEMRGVRTTLESWGHRITSRWIDIDVASLGLGAMGLTAERFNNDPDGCRTFALYDVADIVHCDLMISFTDGEPARGGRHVEFGLAYAWEKRLILCGPREHLFHTLAGVEHYPTWEALARHMGTWCVDMRHALKDGV